MSVFVTVTATLGLITTGGFALLELHTRFAMARLPISLRSLGIALLAGVTAYVAWAVVGKSEFHGRGKWRVRRPTFGLTAKQICLSSLDWMLAGTVLFAVLPSQLPISYGVFLGIYLIAQTAAVVSHVPGGLGVFEAVVVALCNLESPSGVLSPSAATALAGSLFVYRVIYYVLPLLGALALSTVAELIRTRQPQTTPGQIALSTKSTLPAADAI
jgi:uncharacterized membrane protein YbhN (UPF0104 family)